MASSQRGAAAGLALLALLLALLQCAAAQPGVPPMPSWAKGPNTQGPGAWKDFAIKQGEENRALVAAANAALQRWDFLMCERLGLAGLACSAGPPAAAAACRGGAACCCLR